jgi:hypothetical protein
MGSFTRKPEVNRPVATLAAMRSGIDGTGLAFTDHTRWALYTDGTIKCKHLSTKGEGIDLIEYPQAQYYFMTRLMPQTPVTEASLRKEVESRGLTIL